MKVKQKLTRETSRVQVSLTEDYLGRADMELTVFPGDQMDGTQHIRFIGEEVADVVALISMLDQEGWFS